MGGSRRITRPVPDAELARPCRARRRLFRQRNELALARHGVEAARFPIRLGLLDALLARGDEVPPDVAWAVHGGPANHRQPRRRECRYGDAVAGLEDEEAAGLEAVARDVDLARHQIDRSLFRLGVERQLGAGVE